MPVLSCPGKCAGILFFMSTELFIVEFVKNVERMIIRDSRSPGLYKLKLWLPHISVLLSYKEVF